MQQTELRAEIGVTAIVQCDWSNKGFPTKVMILVNTKITDMGLWTRIIAQIMQERIFPLCKCYRGLRIVNAAITETAATIEIIPPCVGWGLGQCLPNTLVPNPPHEKGRK